jgi:hypothetical protein
MRLTCLLFVLHLFCLQLLQPVSELLTTISDLTQNTFGEARGKIDEVSNAMREASETLRNATISNLDRLQAKYLVSTTEGAPATAQKFMNYAYYVSERSVNRAG